MNLYALHEKEHSIGYVCLPSKIPSPWALEKAHSLLDITIYSHQGVTVC